MHLEKVSELKHRLKGDLPGMSAQMEMAPYLRDIKDFEFQNEAKTIQSGVLILLYQYKDELHIPFMLRTSYVGAHSGQVSFPGGKKEESDDDLVATALRESEEELGIPAKDVEILGSISTLFISISNFSVLPVVGFMNERPDFIKEPHEVEEVIEAPISHLLRSSTVKEKDMHVRTGFRLRAPYYAVDNHTIWGATAMMLREFLTIYKEL